MTTKQSASLSVEFNPPAPDVVLALEMHLGPYAEYGFIPIRLYPDVSATLRATRGTAHLGETRVEALDEILDFGGGKTARLKRPNPNDDVVFYSLDVAFDSAGNEVYPTLHYDPDTGEAVSDVSFHGAVRVTYTANYRLVYYRYDVDYDPISGGLTLSSGIVYAFYLGESAQIDVGIESAQSQQYVECYRVYTKVVLDPDGAWELPPGWTEDGSYPDHPEIEARDPDNSFTDERPHRIALINKIGSIVWRWYHVPIVQPYVLQPSYRPKFFIKFATPPSDEWKAAFSRVNKSAIMADVAAAYGPVTTE
ncbi:MAG TPA: hypothetical protein PKY50_06165 [Candidatus Competibacter sp.]|nr:hypothetical protein [Candidatus Competibacter sp.]